MKIIRLKAENVKRLTAVEITPQGDIVQICGANAAGKSSVLDAIWMTICGKAAAPPKPIREGATEAVAELELDELVVRRTWTQAKTTLTVAGKDGRKYPTPQAMLDKLAGPPFNPVGFANLPQKEQAKVLLDLLGIGEKLAELATAEAGAYERRRAANARRDEALTAANAIAVSDDTPDAELDISQLTATLSAAHKRKSEIDSAGMALKQLENTIRASREKAERLQAEIARLERELEQANKTLATDTSRHSEWQSAYGAMIPPDTAQIEKQISEAQSINVSVRQARECRRFLAEAKKYADVAAKEDAAVQSARDARKRLLLDAKWPVSGLSVDQDGATFNGIPLCQCSSSEKIRIGLAVHMARTPDLKVLLVPDGSMLDDAQFADLCKLVSESGFQMWIERAGDPGDKTAIVIEDGHVKQA
jgi:DNA repair exonuclease SbcCD ATPase subunit